MERSGIGDSLLPGGAVIKITLFQDIKSFMDQIIQVRYTDLEAERKACQSLLEISGRENDLYGLAFAHTYLGDYFIAQNNPVDCGYHLQKAKLFCEQNGFNSLLIQVCNLFGICYEALSDEQTALQHYLHALQLIRECKDYSLECVLYNNIASNFGVLENYEKAKKYYALAYSSLERHEPTIPNLSYVKMRIWSNLSEVCRHMGELEESRFYLFRCKEVVEDLASVRQLILWRGQCGYYAATGDGQRAADEAKALLVALENEAYQDKYLIFEILIDTCHIMIQLRNASCSYMLLSSILKMRQDGEIVRSRQIQKLNTQYFEVFGTHEEQFCAYRDFYQVINSLESSANTTKSNGLQNILYLDEIKNSLTLEKQTLHEEAHLEELTGLYNRRYFNKLISKTMLDPAVRSVGFIMLDVDYFKEYNDTYGHAKGDIALCAVAKALMHNTPKGVLASRYGGDEFVCLCVNLSYNEMEGYILAVRASLASAAIEHSASLCSSTLTLSIGYSCHERSEEQTSSVILDEADKALYYAKNAGRNTMFRWSDIKE